MLRSRTCRSTPRTSAPSPRESPPQVTARRSRSRRARTRTWSTITKHVTVVGRCAANVEIKSPAGSVKPGIEVRATGVVVRGVTLTGHVDGISVASVGDATIEDVVIKGSRYAGLYVEGGRATIRRTKVEDTVPQADARGGFDLAVGVAGEATITDSTLSGGVQAVLAGADAKLTMMRVVVTRQAPNPASNVRATGVVAIGGAHVSVAKSVLRDMTTDSAAAAEDDGVIELTDAVVRDVHISGSAARGYGVTATYGGHVALRSSMIANVEKHRRAEPRQEVDARPLLGSDRGAASGRQSDRHGQERRQGRRRRRQRQGEGHARQHRDPRRVGRRRLRRRRWFHRPEALLHRRDARHERCRSLQGDRGGVRRAERRDRHRVRRLRHTQLRGGREPRQGQQPARRSLLVRDVAEGSTDTAGAGIGIGPGSTLDLEASVIDGATTSGLLIKEGSATLVRFAASSIHGTKMARSGSGTASPSGKARAPSSTGTSLVDNPGIGLAVDGGRALVDGVTIARNAVGVHAQNGSFLVEADDADAESLGDGEVRVASTTRFSSNATRVGSGIVPLPSPVFLERRSVTRHPKMHAQTSLSSRWP